MKKKLGKCRSKRLKQIARLKQKRISISPFKRLKKKEMKEMKLKQNGDKLKKNSRETSTKLKE